MLGKGWLMARLYRPLHSGRLHILRACETKALARGHGPQDPGRLGRQPQLRDSQECRPHDLATARGLTAQDEPRAAGLATPVLIPKSIAASSRWAEL